MGEIKANVKKVEKEHIYFIEQYAFHSTRNCSSKLKLNLLYYTIPHGPHLIAETKPWTINLRLVFGSHFGSGLGNHDLLIV